MLAEKQMLELLKGKGVLQLSSNPDTLAGFIADIVPQQNLNKYKLDFPIFDPLI